MMAGNALLSPEPIDATRVNPLAPQPTWADAAQNVAANVGGWIADQRAQSEQQGLWGPGGITPAGARQAGMQVGMAPIMGTAGPKGDAPAVPGFTAYHGSPHDFDAFDASKIGTGEGAQAYGHGLYLADGEAVAQGYRDRLSDVNQFTNDQGPIVPKTAAEKTAMAKFEDLHSDLGSTEQAMGKAYDYLEGAPLKALENYWSHGGIRTDSAGRMYEVHVAADPAHFLDWDKPLSEQPDIVQQKIANLSARGIAPRSPDPQMTGGELYQELMHKAGSSQNVAAHLASPLPGTDAGIPGIRYADAGSRGADGGTKNTVVFDPSIMSIMRKYAIPAAMLSGTGHGLVTGNTGQQ
jgi:hypothetical protein